MKRCKWATTDKEYIKYHDEVWGVPDHDRNNLFAMLCLEGAQAGLSWITILKKWDGYMEAFNNFVPEKVAEFSDLMLDKLRNDRNIVRNHLKINSVRTNALALLQLEKDTNITFDKYIWSFVNYKPISNEFKTILDVPNQTDISIKLSKDLKKRGFKFVGPTIIYAFMQATGMVNDHTQDCFRYKKL